jgi:transposase
MDAEWRLIEPYMPAVKRLGRPRETDPRDLVDAMLYIARTGCQWRLPPTPWASVNTDKQSAELQARLAGDPEWYGGRYYGKAACKTALTDIRVETLKRYGIEAALAPRLPDPVAREAAIREQAAKWAAKWDANSLIILRRALLGFEHEAGLRQDQG